MDLHLVRLKKFEIYALANGMDKAYQGVDVVAKNWSTNGYINWSENKAIVV